MPTASRCSMTSSSSSSSTVCRRARVSSSCCRSVACLAPTPGAREDLLVAVGAGADALDVAFEAADVAVQVARPGLHLHQLVLRRAHRRLGRGQLGVLGQRAAAVGEPVELGVDVGEVQQAPLDGGVGLHWGVLPIGCARRRSRDPCGASRRGPRRYRPAPRAGRRPPARTTATPTPSARRRPARAPPRPQQVLRRRVVAQVGGDVGVDARRERPRRARSPPRRRTPRPG